MMIECCHMGLACSTLILGDFHSSIMSFEAFKMVLKELMQDSNEVADLFKYHAPKAFSFVLVSTLDKEGWKNINSYLEKLGFTATEPSPNLKNGTTVRLHTISCVELCKTLGLSAEDE